MTGVPTRNDTRKAVYARWIAAWDDETPYCFENEKFDPPDGPWARVSMRHTGGQQETLGAPGNRNFERTGFISIQLFEPPGKGVGGSDSLVERVLDIFEGCNVPGSDILLFDAVGRELGVVEEGRWWASQVQINFSWSAKK